MHEGSIGRDHLGGCRGCDPVLDRLANLLEGAGFDLAHAFARHAEFVCELIELARLFGEAAGHEDPPLTLVEQLERLFQRLAAFLSRDYAVLSSVSQRYSPLEGR